MFRICKTVFENTDFSYPLLIKQWPETFRNIGGYSTTVVVIMMTTTKDNCCYNWNLMSNAIVETNVYLSSQYECFTSLYTMEQLFQSILLPYFFEYFLEFVKTILNDR